MVGAIIVPDGMFGGAFRVVGVSGGGSPTQARVTFSADANGGLIVDHASIGIKAGAGNAWDTTATPVELKFSGVSGFSIAANGSITSDWANLAISSSTGVVLSRTLNNAIPGWNGGYSIRTVTTAVTGGGQLVVDMDLNTSANWVANTSGSDNTYYGVGSNYANATPSGFSLSGGGGTLFSVTSIESQ